MPRASSACSAMPPAMHRGAVRRPEKCPPPATSCMLWYFTRAGKVCVPGAWFAAQLGIVFGARVGVLDNCCDGCASGVSIDYTGNDMRGVGLAALGCGLVATGGTTVQKGLQRAPGPQRCPRGRHRASSRWRGSATGRRCLSAKRYQRSRTCYSSSSVTLPPSRR